MVQKGFARAVAGINLIDACPVSEEQCHSRGVACLGGVLPQEDPAQAYALLAAKVAL